MSSNGFGIAQSGRAVRSWLVSSAHLSIASLLEDKAGWEVAPVAHLLGSRQAATGLVAPAGAKGWLRVSMCQIASASRRARST